MKSTSSKSQGLLLFKLTDTQTFAIGTLKVQEIVPYVHLTQFPQIKQHILGAASIRGNTVPVIDIASAVGYAPITEEEKKQCVIILTDCSRQNVGFLVRGIEKIIDCNWKNISPPPKALGHQTYITGITRFEEKLIELLDIEFLLSELFPYAEEEAHIEISSSEKGILQSCNILLVDDSGVARKQLESALTSIDIPYKVCKNGNDAFEVMKESAEEGSKIDILVSDIEMPGLDGYELAFEIRDTPAIADVYIILHTSLSSEISVSRAEQVGADKALTKFNSNALIRAMLEGAKTRK